MEGYGRTYAGFLLISDMKLLTTRASQRLHRCRRLAESIPAQTLAVHRSVSYLRAPGEITRHRSDCYLPWLMSGPHSATAVRRRSRSGLGKDSVRTRTLVVQISRLGPR